MGTGYTRQSAAEIDDGLVVDAVDLEDEFDALEAAFNAITGHAHDGTAGEGPKISLTTSISGVLPIANGGVAGIHKLDATTDPTVNDDTSEGYAVGSWWANITGDYVYVCIDATEGAAVWLTFQDYDDNLQAIADLTPAADKLIYWTGADTAALTDLTSFGRSLIDDANAATARSTLGLVIGTDVQAFDTDLSAIGDMTPTNDDIIQRKAGVWANRTMAELLADLSAVGTTFQPLDSDLTAIAALSPSNDDFIQRKAGAWTNRTMAQLATDLALSTTYQPLDADLTAIAALTTAAAGRSILTLSDPNADRIAFWDDSAGAYAHLAPSSGISISGTNLIVNANETIALAPSASQNNYSTGAATAGGVYSVINISPTASVVITGISTTSWESGKRVLLRNATSHTGADGRLIIIPRNSTSSSAANRFQYPGNKRLPLTLMPGETAEFMFDGTDLKYIRSNRSMQLSNYFDYHFHGIEYFDPYTSGTGAGFTYAVSTTDENSDKYVAFNLDTGTTTTGHCALIDNGGALNIQDTCLMSLARVNVPTLSTGTDEFDVSVGFTEAGISVDQIAWVYDRNISTSWILQTRDNTATTSSSGIFAVQTTSHPLLGVFVNADGTRVEGFYSNDAGVTWTVTSAITTNIPNSPARSFGSGVAIVKSAGTTARSVNVNFAGQTGWL